MKWFIIFFHLIYSVNAYKILYLFPLASSSHKIIFTPIIQELSKRGHHITIVTPNRFFLKQSANIREIIVGETIELSIAFKKFFNDPGRHIVPSGLALTVPACENYLANQEVKELLKQGKQFDVAVVGQVLNDCALATAPILAKYVMYHSTSLYIPTVPSFAPQPSSFVPNAFGPYGTKMTFFQRLDNTVSWILTRLFYDYYYIPSIQAVIAKHIPQNPSVIESRKAICFTITNADPVITSARPSLPNIKDLGGVNCRDSKPVSKEYEDFIDSAGENGFIFFSLGSIIHATDIPSNVKLGLLNAFSKVKQNVLWKYENELENVGKNIKIKKWIPQQDILGHPKIRLFITHGGMLSLQESIYHGVPVLVIPLFAEQASNAARLEAIGVGLKVDANNVSESSIYEGVTEILNNKSFSDNVKKYSNILRAFTKNQVENQAYWVEYVIRHKGATHLRSFAEKLNLYQYYSLDIVCFLFAVLAVLIWAAIKFYKILLRLKH